MQDLFDFKLLEDGTYCAMKYYGNDESVEIPASFLGRPVTILYDGLFEHHREITKVTIPDSVTDIGGFMFDGCDHLNEIILPDSVVNLWQYAFVRSSLTEVKLSDGIDTIPLFAFKDCRSLKRVIAGSGLKKVSAWAFQGCTSLESFEHPENTVIDERAFDILPS